MSYTTTISALITLVCLIITCTVLFARGATSGEEQSTLEFVATPHIKMVKLHRVGNELSEPTIKLNSGEQLLLSFDDIAENPDLYSYSIIHCDPNWEPSNLFLSDFADGFEVNEIMDYSYSTGTIASYMHSQLRIPNSDFRFRVSGNYLIRIFSRYDPETILIQRRFIVYEPLVDISLSVKQPPHGLYRHTGQQLDVQVDTKPIRVTDPFSEVQIVACQNYLFQGCLTDVKPTHITGNTLDYSNPDALIFEGINEFRVFDIMSTQRISQGVQSMEYFTDGYHARLTPDKSRRRRGHTHSADLNGRFVIKRENSDLGHIEADYIWVYFTLKPPMELDLGKDVYIFGELTGWMLSPDSKMQYSHERNTYEKRLLLKQGGYSYRYVVADSDTGEVDMTHYEGSHFETENNYYLMVYYKPMGSRFHRIVGLEVTNTGQR